MPHKLSRGNYLFLDAFCQEDYVEQKTVIDDLFILAYEELRRLALAVRRNDPSVTLNPTALVHEAFMKLAGSPVLQGTSPLHFKRVAARAMRQVLVEAARRRQADKRGGAGMLQISLDDWPEVASTSNEEFLTLDDTLNQLALINPRQEQVVEARFFGGLDVSETAILLNISEETVARDWRAAKAWLSCELRRR